MIPLLGDCKELGLGLSPTDRQLIEEKVSVVFHCAASVRFDDTLKNSIILNVRGTREVMLIARNMKELKVCLIVFNKWTQCIDLFTSSLYTDLFTKGLKFESWMGQESSILHVAQIDSGVHPMYSEGKAAGT
jgi:hypothetical protein